MVYAQADRLVFRYNFRLSMLRFWWPETANLDQMQPLLISVLRTIRRYQAQQLLLDMSHMPTVDEKVQKWLQNTWLPRLRHCGLRRLALLLPTSTYNMILVESMLWASVQEHLPYEVQYFTELPAALEWLTDSEVATSSRDWPLRRREPLVLRVRRRQCAARFMSPA